MNILVAEPLAPAGVKLLQEQAGWNVIISNPKEYAQHLADADALIVRSAVKVNQAVLDQAPKLKVIGRAGVGVDNVDMQAATAAGILVMNTPGGNAVSVAEHTFALMLGLARSIPQASNSTKSGKWEKKKFLGNELRGKVLGVVGLGSIGREVVRRARAFEMRVLASDPYVSSQTAAGLGIELVDLNRLYADSDYISLHVALTPETNRMLSTDAFEKMKRGVRILNCARGELIDEKALKAAMDSGKVAGAALDVFEKEPPAEDPILTMETLIATPHIGGSTEEAQETVGVRIVEQLVDYLQNGVAINAVNIPALTAEQYRTIGPYAELAERLGTFAANIATGNPNRVRLIYYGRIADQKTVLVRNAGVAGALSRSVARRPNTVNAMQLADDRGVTVAEVHEHRADHTDSVRLELDADGGTIGVEGAVVLGQPRLIQVDGIACEAPLEGHLVFLKNQDVPGVIGYVGGVLGKHGINIATFSLGRREARAEAVSVIATDQSVPDEVLSELLKNPAVVLARKVEFTNQTATARA
ncbi:MAG TPA: phosphoglycerate dehydrogenase [Bryobacteraceae bacterium]|nr:phosphoglycerate dehydrogenase [Bryobacteraceae bacterium]